MTNIDFIRVFKMAMMRKPPTDQSFRKYAQHFIDSFNGKPVEPSSLGSWHSFVCRNVLIHKPDDLKAIEIYVAEGNLVKKRDKAINRLISEAETKIETTSFSDESMNDIVNHVLENYYKKNNQLHNHSFITLKLDHENAIKKIQPITLEEKERLQKEIKGLVQDIETSRKKAAKFLAEQTELRAKNINSDALTKVNSSYQQTADKIAAMQSEIKTIELKFNHKEQINDLKKIQDVQQQIKLKSNEVSVKTALEKYVTELKVWKWVEDQLKDKESKLYSLYNKYNQSQIHDPDDLEILVKHICEKNPIAKLFSQQHLASETTLIKAFIMQRIEWKNQHPKKDFHWLYVCPLTEFSIDKVTNKNKPAVSGQATPGSQPTTPRSKKEEKDASPHSPDKKLELKATVAVLPFSSKKAELTLPTTQAPISPRSASVSKSGQKSLLSTVNESKKQFDRPHLSKNPLRWVSAGFNGLAEGTLKASSVSPLTKYSVGLFVGGPLALTAMVVKGSVDFISAPCHAIVVGCKKIKNRKKKEKTPKPAFKYSEDNAVKSTTPRTPRSVQKPASGTNDVVPFILTAPEKRPTTADKTRIQPKPAPLSLTLPGATDASHINVTDSEKSDVVTPMASTHAGIARKLSSRKLGTVTAALKPLNPKSHMRQQSSFGGFLKGKRVDMLSASLHTREMSAQLIIHTGEDMIPNPPSPKA